MTLGESLVAAIRANSGLFTSLANRQYPIVLPQSPVTPLLTYRVISRPSFATLTGSSGLSDFRLEVSVFDKSISSAERIALQVQQLLDGFMGQLGGGVTVAIYNINGPRPLFDNDSRLYYAQSDIMGHLTESTES